MAYDCHQPDSVTSKNEETTASNLKKTDSDTATPLQGNSKKRKHCRNISKLDKRISITDLALQPV